MSALTKVFVVLLVVLSLVLSAGLIVFVNRQENYKISEKAAEKKAEVAQAAAEQKDAEVQKLQAQKSVAVADLETANKGLAATIIDREKTIADQAVQISQRTSEVALAQAAQTSAVAALTVAQADIAKRQEAFNQLKTLYDASETEKVGESNRITELTNAYEVTGKHDRFMAEQNTQLAQENAQLKELLRKYNISPTGANPPAGGPLNLTPSVNINGIVRETRNINGVPYATISLGSADAVTRGMQFKVIDPQRAMFLGYLTVDSVDTHESSGRLTGPAVNQVRANASEVRTQ